MPRIHGVRERRDKIWYDTCLVRPNTINPVRFFTTANIGDIHKTNLQVAGSFSTDQTYIAMGIGARLLGKTRAEEDLLLDHIHIQFVMGDMPQHDIMGPHASMLSPVYTEEELETYQRKYLELRPEDVTRRSLPKHRPPCYVFIKPITTL